MTPCGRASTGTAVHADDARRCAKECAAHRNRLAVHGRRGKLEQVGVIAECAQTRLGDFEPETFREGGRIHFVHVGAAGILQKAFENGARDRGGVDFVHFAAVINVQPLDVLGRDLREKPSELFSETQMRADNRERFRVEVRHVDRIADRSFEKRGADRLGDFDANAFLRLGRGSAEMWRENNVRQIAQR